MFDYIVYIHMKFDFHSFFWFGIMSSFFPHDQLYNLVIEY